MKREEGAELPRVLVVGAARSGTSWLSRAMERGRDVRFYYEPDNIDADPTGNRPPGRRGFGPYPVVDVGDLRGPVSAMWDVVFAGRSPFNHGRQALIPLARAILDTPRWLRDPAMRAAALVSRWAPRDTGPVVVKSVYAAFCLEWLAHRYRPAVIAVQRNPLNVVSSWRELHIPLFDLATRTDVRERYVEPLKLPAPAREASELERIAWHVGLLTHAMGTALARHPEWHLVTHEDLCVAPAMRIRAVFDRAGLMWTDQVDRFLEESNRPGSGLEPVRVTAEQPGRWRQRLSGEEVSAVQAVLAQFPERGWLRRQDSELA